MKKKKVYNYETGKHEIYYYDNTNRLMKVEKCKKQSFISFLVYFLVFIVVLVIVTNLDIAKVSNNLNLSKKQIPSNVKISNNSYISKHQKVN